MNSNSNNYWQDKTSLLGKYRRGNNGRWRKRRSDFAKNIEDDDQKIFNGPNRSPAGVSETDTYRIRQEDHALSANEK